MVTSGGLRWSPWLCLFLVIGWTLSVSSAQTHEKRIRLVRNGNTIRTRLSANVPVRRNQQQVNRRSRVRAVPINPTDLGGYASAPTTGYSTQSQAGYVRQQGQGGYGQVEQMTGSGYEDQQQQSSPRQNAYSSQSQNSPVSQQPQRSSQTSQRQQQQQQQQDQGYIYNQPQRSQQSGVNRPSQSSRRPAPIPDPVNEAQIITDEPEQPLPVQPEQDYTQQTEQPFNVETEQRIDADSILPDSTATPIDIMRTTARAQTSSSSGHSDDGSYHHSMDDFWPDGYKGVIPGEEGVDYPVYNTIPETSFSCSDQSYSGYYADVEARCQVFHVCLRRATRRSIEKWSFLCPNGTVFSQEDFVCVWWNQAQSCDSDTLGRLYELNARLGWDSHDESGMKSIQTIMQSMMTAPTTPAKTLLQQPDLSQGGFDQDVRPTRIPVRLSASLGNQGNGGIRKVNVETSVPVTMITPDDIVTSSPQNDYDGQSQVEIDSQPVVDTSLTSNSESQSRTKTASAFLKSQSEAYEQFGDPNGLENPKPFIVNNPPISQDNSLEEPTVGAQGTDGDNVPTLMMLPVQQQYPDGTTTVVDMPIMVISNKQRPVMGFPPAAVVNPNGVTIPNRPVQPPRSYLPPRRDPTTTQPSSVNSFETTIPVQVEEEVSQSYDYVDTDKEPPGTRPVVDYEVNSDAPEPVTPEAITDKPSNTYLPPRGQRPAILTGPDPDFALPIQNDIQTDEPVTSTLAPVIEDQTLQTEGPSYAPVDRPVTTYRPAPPTALPQIVRRPQVQTTFTAMQGDVVNQILQSGGATGTVNEQIQDSRRNEDEVQYPTPGSSEVNQDNAPNVGTSAQLYNGNVRNIYRQNTDVKSTTTELPTNDKDRNSQLLQQIQNGGYGNTGSGNDITNNLEQITPGYIELPRGTEPTESSRAELPGTESVQAFLTSQKNVDQKQTLQIYEFNKYALFVPKDGQNGVSGGYSLPSGTPAPAGLVQSSPAKATTPNPQRNLENLFGPRAKDVLNQIQLIQTSQPQQPRGYSNQIVPVPSKPSGLYETPNKEFKGYQQSNGAQPRPQNVQVRPTSQPLRQPQSQQQVSSQQQRPQQGGYSQQQQQQQQQRPQQSGYSQQQPTDSQQKRPPQQNGYSQQVTQQQAQQQRPQQQQNGYSQQVTPQQAQQQRPQQQQNGYSQQVTQQQAQQQQPQQQQNGYSQQVTQQQAQQQQPQQQQNGYSQQVVQQQGQQPQQQQVQQQVQQQRPQQAKPQQQQSGYSLQQQQRPQSSQQNSSPQQQQQQSPQQQNGYQQQSQTNPSQGYSIVPTVARPPSNLYLPPTQQSGQQQIIAQQPGFALAGPQIQLPVYVESHTTQTVQIPTPAPQGYQTQQQQQPQVAPQGYQQQQQQQQQAPQGYQQQQQQQQQAPQGYQLQQQQQPQQGYQPQQQASPVSVPSQQAPPVPRPASPSYFYAPPTVDEALNLLQPQSSSLSNNIQIPDGDIRIPQLSEIRANGAEFIPAIPVHSQTIVETRKVPQQNQQQVAPAQLQQQYPQFAPVSTPGPIQQQYAQLSQVAPQGYNNILGPNAHVVNSPFTQVQSQFFSHLSQATPQIQAPQQQQPTFQPILNPNNHVSVQRATLQPVDISALNVAYPSAINYQSNVPQTQQSSGGYRDVQRFNAEDAVHTPTQHQQFFEGHQDSHQQSVQNFIQQTRLQAQQSSQNLQHLSLASSQSLVAVPPPKGFYPGKDKSVGVSLTY